MEVLKIEDGRDAFWQWDLGRRLIVSDEKCREVHFDNGTTEKLPVCEVFKEDGKSLVEVPNLFLQNDKPLFAYAYIKDENGAYTIRVESFEVLPKVKPADYIYTETEVKSWEDLADRIGRLEEGGVGGGGAAGENGGYYIPEVSQLDETTVQISFAASKDGMEPVPNQQIVLPRGPKGEPGDGDGNAVQPADLSWKVIVDSVLEENTEDATLMAWKLTQEATEDMKKMSEFKLLVKLPFTEDISVKTFDIMPIFSNAKTSKNYVLFQVNNVECTGGTQDKPKTIFVTALITRMDTMLYTTLRQAASTTEPISPVSMARECETDGVSLFDAEMISVKLQLKAASGKPTTPVPVGTRVLLEGR